MYVNPDGSRPLTPVVGLVVGSSAADSSQKFADVLLPVAPPSMQPSMQAGMQPSMQPSIAGLAAAERRASDGPAAARLHAEHAERSALHSASSPALLALGSLRGDLSRARAAAAAASSALRARDDSKVVPGARAVRQSGGLTSSTTLASSSVAVSSSIPQARQAPLAPPPSVSLESVWCARARSGAACSL